MPELVVVHGEESCSVRQMVDRVGLSLVDQGGAPRVHAVMSGKAVLRRGSLSEIDVWLFKTRRVEMCPASCLECYPPADTDPDELVNGEPEHLWGGEHIGRQT